MSYVNLLINGNDNLTKKELEKLGTYILESRDIISSRKLESPFFVTNKQAKMWKEFSCRLVEEDLFKGVSNDVEFDYGLNKEWLDCIFKNGLIKPSEKIRLIKSYQQFEEISSEKLLEHLYFVLQEIFNNIKDNMDLVILNLISFGYNQNQISKKINMSQQFISKRLKRVIEN